MMIHDIDALSWSDVKSSQFDLAILPWGATEPHNLHLPYTTDNLLSRAISLDAAEKASPMGVKAVVLPAIPFGSQNPGQTDYLFCIHASTETQKSILHDIVASLYRQGLRKLVIINGHGGNNFTGYIRDLAIEYPDFYIVASEYYKTVDAKPYFVEAGDHAGELETSMMLHYFPELVKPKDMYGKGDTKEFTIKSLKERKFWLPRNWSAVSEDTGIGNPEHASAEKGRLFSDAVSTQIAEFLKDFASVSGKDLYK